MSRVFVCHKRRFTASDVKIEAASHHFGIGIDANAGLGVELLSSCILGDAIAKDIGISSSWFFAAFSASLLVAAVLGPRIGRTIDTFGGCGVLSASNVVLAAGLALLGLAHSIWLVSSPSRPKGQRRGQATSLWITAHAGAILSSGAGGCLAKKYKERASN